MFGFLPWPPARSHGTPLSWTLDNHSKTPNKQPTPEANLVFSYSVHLPDLPASVPKAISHGRLCLVCMHAYQEYIFFRIDMIV
eukprot:1320665-Amorphochlora_amoeboformis.AAC.3